MWPSRSIHTGNNLVWRQLLFGTLTTSRIRVFITGTVDGYSRLTDVEAYAPAAPVLAINVYQMP